MRDVRELFRENLRKLREAKGYSQRELSELCDYTRSYVGQLERGEKDPSFESLIRLSEALDLSILDFFRNDKEGLEVELTEALEEMTNFSNNNIRSLTTFPELMNWEHRMVSLLNPHGRILDFNRTVYEFVKETKDQILGLPIWDLSMFCEDRGQVSWLQNCVNLIQEEQKIYRCNFSVETDADSDVEVEFSLTPIAVTGSRDCYIVSEGHRCEDIRVMESPLEPLQG